MYSNNSYIQKEIMRKVIVVLVCAILFILPFFWLAPGELEMGGDSNRLFLYDPGSYLNVNALYSIDPDGVGKVRPDQFLLPFLFVLKFVHRVFQSGYILTSLLNSLKLVGSFLSMYLFVREILKSYSQKIAPFPAYAAGMLAGFFYTFSPGVGGNIPSALLTHNQVFLNPLVSYLLLRFLLSHQEKYLWVILLVTFVFSPNFSLKAPPPLFAFYPLVFLFLLLYVSVILRKSLPWKKLFVGLLLFIGIHAFHIFPVVSHIFDATSQYYVRAFSTAAGKNVGLDYFNAARGLGKVINNIFLSYAQNHVRWATLVPPLVIIIGFILNKKKARSLLLIVSFFLITLFLSSANITDIGIEFYRMLFYIPGFSMFRVFYGQWQWVHTFFYAMLFGYSLYVVLIQIRRRYAYVLIMLFIVLHTISSWTFVGGQILRGVHPGSKNMTSIMRMNPDYEQALAFIKTRPDDGNVFNFPFTDFFYQVVPGQNQAAYIGLSPTSYLTGKRAFSGYQTIYPFPESFLKLIREKNYVAIKRLFGLLNSKYIFYIKDPKAFTQYYPTWPYSLFLSSVPNSEALTELVDALRADVVFEKGDYAVYETDKDYYLPHMYTATNISPYEPTDDWYGKNASFFVENNSPDPRVAYVERDTCGKVFSEQECLQNTIKYTGDLPVITYKRVNPIKYKVEVSAVRSPFVLVFSDKFHSDWKLYVSKKEAEELNVGESYFNGSIRESTHEDIFLNGQTFETLDMQSIPENQHFMVNGYANAWYITPTDSLGNQRYEIIIEMVQQRVFYYSLGISIVSLCIFLLYGIKLIKNRTW